MIVMGIFLAGLMVGGGLGAVIMALLAASGREAETEE